MVKKGVAHARVRACTHTRTRDPLHDKSEALCRPIALVQTCDLIGTKEESS